MLQFPLRVPLIPRSYPNCNIHPLLSSSQQSLPLTILIRSTHPNSTITIPLVAIPSSLSLPKCQIQPHPVKFSLPFHSQWFVLNTETTIEEAFVSKTITINNTFLKLEVWNTDRSEKYQSLALMYHRDARTGMLLSHHKSATITGRRSMAVWIPTARAANGVGRFGRKESRFSTIEKNNW
jgi:GTPase SAR1 family protein